MNLRLLSTMASGSPKILDLWLLSVRKEIWALFSRIHLIGYEESNNRAHSILLSLLHLGCSIGWIDVAASLFCAFTSIYLQKNLPQATVHDIITQSTMLRALKTFSTTKSMKCPTDTNSYKLSILVFSHASRATENGQLLFIKGLLIGELSNGSILHTISWSSRKSRRSVKSIASAEVLVVGAGIDEGKVLVKLYESLLKTSWVNYHI